VIYGRIIHRIYMISWYLYWLEKFQIAFPVKDTPNFSFLLQSHALPSLVQHKKQIQALFIPVLLHKQSQPDDSVQHCWKFPVPKGHTYLFRSFQASFLPNGLFAQIITKILHTYFPNILVLWRQGIVFDITELNNSFSNWRTPWRTKNLFK